MRATMWVGLVVGSVMGAAMVAPAAADGGSGTASITFDKRTWAAITSEVVITATGKAEPIGQCCPCGPPRSQVQLSACCPCIEDGPAAGATCETTGEAARSFAMPAVMRGTKTLLTKGGLTITRNGRELQMDDLVVDLERKSASVKLTGVARRHTLLKLSNVKRNGWLRAQLRLAKGEANTLNSALDVDVFRPRMRLGQLAFESD